MPELSRAQRNHTPPPAFTHALTWSFAARWSTAVARRGLSLSSEEQDERLAWLPRLLR